jgi:hypothetical protein
MPTETELESRMRGIKQQVDVPKKEMFVSAGQAFDEHLPPSPDGQAVAWSGTGRLAAIV